MTALSQMLVFLLVLSILVLVHELGHYLAARLMKIRVEVFSFGLGKRLLGKKIGDTDFRISLIPLGGYVRMAGEEEFDPQNLKPYEFQAKNRAQKIFTLIMGPLMNLVLTVFLITAINMKGVEIESYKMETPRIGYVEVDSPAAAAGLQKGDVLLAIAGRTVKIWRDVEIAIGTSPRENVAIAYSRNGQKMETKLKVESLGRLEIGYAGFYWEQPAVVDEVSEGYPAHEAGLRKDDRIVAVNGQPVSNYFEVKNLVRQSAAKPLQLTVQRSGRSLFLTMTPKIINGIGVIGFTVFIAASKIRYNLPQALGNSISESGKLLSLTLHAFAKLIQGKMSARSLSGPIEIARISEQALRTNLSNFFMLIAFISLQLGLVNIFPVPGLDGGHLLIFIIEAIIRRDLNQKLKMALIYIGFSLLLVLMAFTILNDIAKTLPHGWQSLLPFLSRK